MTEKQKNAMMILKWCSIICGVGEIICGILTYVWDKETLTAASLLLDGIFKLTIGYGLVGLLNKDTFQSKDDDDEQE